MTRISENRLRISVVIFSAALVGAGWFAVSDAAEDEARPAITEQPATVAEARGRARLLHETLHATLQIVHHQYYVEDEGMLLPARTLRTVFDELARSKNIKLRWLAVEGQAMNVDHKPQDEFETAAVKALAADKDEFEQVVGNLYRYAGPITLGGECLKCHVPNRKNTEDHTAGLLISMPFGTQ